MATPRHKLVDQERPCAYHLASRCVRRAWLCGRDKHTGRDYSHRKSWLLERLLLLARCFAVEVYAYAVMSNHFHIVVHYDPNACLAWSDEEVARRWVDAFPPKAHGAAAARKAEAHALLLGDPDRLARARRTLGSLSDFMKHLRIGAPFPHLSSYVNFCFIGIFSLKSTCGNKQKHSDYYNEFTTFSRRVRQRGRLRLPATSSKHHCSAENARRPVPGGHPLPHPTSSCRRVRRRGRLGLMWPRPLVYDRQP